jgi:AraC-like DNA-binding protein
MAQALLRRDSCAGDALRGDELLVDLLRTAMSATPVRNRPSAQTVERAKEYLHAHACERITLAQVSSAVGVSAVYLTQEFKRSEGIPLYQYQLSLRLARALIDLPRTDDITGLALDLGFSSHSHFTHTFRKAFHITPSEFRRSATLHHPVRKPRARERVEWCGHVSASSALYPTQIAVGA